MCLFPTVVAVNCVAAVKRERKGEGQLKAAQLHPLTSTPHPMLMLSMAIVMLFLYVALPSCISLYGYVYEGRVIQSGAALHTQASTYSSKTLLLSL